VPLDRRARRSVAITAAALTFLSARAAHAADKETCIAESTLAQQRALDRKFVEARAHFLACAREVCPVPVVKDCTAQLARVDASIATVVVLAKDAATGRSLPGRVRVDDGEKATSLDGGAVSVDPGTHVFHVEIDSGETRDESVVVEEGARLKAVVATFARPSARVEKKPIPAGVFVLGGIGVVALGVTTVVGIEALSQWKDLRSRPPTAYTDSDVSSLKTKRVVADVSLAAGVVALGAAAGWVLFRPTPREARHTWTPDVSVGVRHCARDVAPRSLRSEP
jgi:hypothetical protein